MPDTVTRNSTFQGGSPTWANACVGNNGHPSYSEYASGFSSAANLLIKSVLNAGGVKLPVDEYIYPICFNMRHSIELRIKQAVIDLQKLSKYGRSIKEYNLEGSHDIGKLWAFFVESAIRVDRRYEKFISTLDEYINDIASVDPTGQTFRYPFNNENRKHLTKVSIINIANLYSRFNKIESELNDLQRLNDELICEYSWETYTNKLSRADIEVIAPLLPPRSTWGDDDFVSIKKDIRKKYSISNNEFSKALNFIQNHYELCEHIGLEKPLSYVNKDTICIFFECWNKEHEIHNRAAPDSEISLHTEFSPETFFEDLEKGAEIDKENWATISQKLSLEELAELNALFYFARDKDYSERFIFQRELDIKELEAEKDRSIEEYRESVMHLLSKTNGIDNIVMSLLFLKQFSLADYLIEKYELANHCEWLDRARSRELFIKYDYLYAPCL